MSLRGDDDDDGRESQGGARVPQINININADTLGHGRSRAASGELCLCALPQAGLTNTRARTLRRRPHVRAD